MEKTLVLREIREPIGFLRLNRPEKKNALSTAVRDAIEEAFRSFLKNDQVRAVVLSSEGDFFSAGYDLKEVHETKGEAFSHRFRELHELIYTYPKPIVVAVKGGAMAGGLDLMLCGDFIFAEPGALFAVPEVHFGLNPFLTVLRARMGIQKAFQFALEGKRISAEEALQLGLIDAIFPKEKLTEEAEKKAVTLARIPCSSVRMLKKVLAESEGRSRLSCLDLEIETHLDILKEKSFLSGLESYLASLKRGK